MTTVIETHGLTKTYGAIGIAGGRSVTELIANEFVTVGSGADIFAWDDINIGTGMDAQGAAINLIGARAITDVYNYALIPITPELDAEASAVDNATVTVAGGARVRSVRDVRIGSRRGLSDAKTVAAGHNPYSESTHEVINTPGNELVKYDHRLKVDGSVMAGVRSSTKVTIDINNNLSYRVEDGSGDASAAVDPLLIEGGLVQLSSVDTLQGEAPDRVFVKTTLNAREEEICAALGPALKERGLIFVGIDVIGDYLTEINVTSPTGIREVKKFGGADVASLLWDAIEKKREAQDF